MKIGIPMWGEWVSPVFDAARRLLVVEIHDKCEVTRREEVIPEASFPQRTQRMVDLGVDVLICNAISRSFEHMLTASGRQVIPWRSGPVEEVIKAYLEGGLNHPRFLMPGCCSPKHKPTP